MPKLFSPLSESVLDGTPTTLRPRCGFVIQQLGGTPPPDTIIRATLQDVFGRFGFTLIDANFDTGAKDYLARILDLIRSTGFAVVIYSDETRRDSLGNIFLEAGYAAMLGKHLVIAKWKGANGPSDFKRTDWIEYDPDNPVSFEDKIGQISRSLNDYVGFEATHLDVILQAHRPDCGVAFERIRKGFLLSGEPGFLDAAEKLLPLIDGDTGNHLPVSDLSGLADEIKMFVRLARRVLPLR